MAERLASKYLASLREAWSECEHDAASGGMVKIDVIVALGRHTGALLAEIDALNATIETLRAALDRTTNTLNNQPYFTDRKEQTKVEEALWHARRVLGETAPQKMQQ